LRDENNRLKGEEGKPDITANKKKGLKNDHSSEKERKAPTEHHKRSKNEIINETKFIAASPYFDGSKGKFPSNHNYR
jgi:hypothetical protein